MASNKKVIKEGLSSIQSALVSYDEVQAWMTRNPVTVTDPKTKEKKDLERSAISLTVNADDGLYYATVNYCAGPHGEYVVTNDAGVADLQYNAQTVGLRKALWATVQSYAPAGYAFDPGDVGSRGGEGVTKQLAETKVVVNELVQTLVPLVRAGVLDIAQVPESSRAQVQALLAA